MKRTTNNNIVKIPKSAAIILLATIYLMIFSCTLSQAQSGGPYVLEWSTIDGGGGTTSGGDYVLTSTIGQPDAGRMASCAYHLSGGFRFGPPCVVDLRDFARFSLQWLQSGAVEANLDGQGDVDILDFYIFVSCWLCYCSDDWPL